MAIAGVELEASGLSSASGSDTTNSFAPTANELIIATIHAGLGGTPAPPAPTLAGNSLTYVQIQTLSFTDGSSQTHRLTMFRAMDASPTSGTVVITTGSTVPDSQTWSFVEYQDIDTGGDDGADAVVTSNNQTQAGATSPAIIDTPAFSALGDGTDNAIHVGMGIINTNALTEESGMTAYTERSFFLQSMDAWRLGDGDLTPSFTFTDIDWGIVGIEIKAVVAGGANPHGPFGHPFHGAFGGPI